MRIKKILMTECLASSRTIYRKLKHLHQTECKLCRMPDNGIWRIAVVVPSRNAMYVWFDYCNEMRAISLDDEDNFVTYQNLVKAKNDFDKAIAKQKVLGSNGV